ncbi:2379_t:CDS:2 [Diversispora eburnea]|uniref:2379_t:CDS:1 n=1 Tax=Diversispora eburnea TaxID=1213867 RepID=A0A9N9AAD8_9GLOM|nr:2379_t:CDS:2 [Diversispora eburnea]
MNPSTSRRSALLLLTLIAILLFFIITPIQSSPLPVDQGSLPAPDNNTTTSVDGGDDSVFSGDATFYSPGLGACGFYNSEHDMIVALNVEQFGPGNPNLNPNCNRLIEITCGKETVIARITDKCPGCNFGSLDLSPAVFTKLAPLSVGRMHISWVFLKVK